MKHMKVSDLQLKCTTKHSLIKRYYVYIKNTDIIIGTMSVSKTYHDYSIYYYVSLNIFLGGVEENFANLATPKEWIYHEDLRSTIIIALSKLITTLCL